MPNIYITATITTLISVGIIGGTILKKTKKEYLWLIMLVFVLQIPSSFLFFYGLRIPINRWIVGAIGTGGLWKFTTTFYAPLTEEFAKIWPLLLPFVFRSVNKKNFIKVGMALGLGFGVGEIWFLAHQMTLIPELSKYAWYMLSGFMSERFIVCFFHGVFTTTILYFWKKKKQFGRGFIYAMLLHYFLNFPIYLAGIRFAGITSKDTWQIILGLWINLFYLLFLLALFMYYVYGRKTFRGMGKNFYGYAWCPACKKKYARPFFALSLIKQRYERCPYCKKWHLTKMLQEAKNDEEK